MFCPGKHSRESSKSKNFLIAISVILAVLNVLRISPWFAFCHGEIEISQTMNEILNNDNEALVSIEKDVNMLVYLIDKPKQVCINGTYYRFIPSENQQKIRNCASSKYILSKSDIPPDEYLLFVNAKEYFIYSRSP